MFSQTNTPGRFISDELGEAREAQPFRTRSRGEVRGGARPPGKIAEQSQHIFNEIRVFSQKNKPGRRGNQDCDCLASRTVDILEVMPGR